MFAHVTNDDAKLETAVFDYSLTPKFHILNGATSVPSSMPAKVAHPLSERFANEVSCLSDPIPAVSVEVLASSFKRNVHIEKKPTDTGSDSAVLKDVTNCSKQWKSQVCRAKEVLQLKKCTVDPRLSKERTTRAKVELDLPLPLFGFEQTQLPIDVVIGHGREAELTANTDSQNRNTRCSRMESLGRSINLLDELTESQFRSFCDKIEKFQQDIDTEVSKHHIAHSD